MGGPPPGPPPGGIFPPRWVQHPNQPETEPEVDIEIEPDINECCLNAQNGFVAWFAEIKRRMNRAGTINDPKTGEPDKMLSEGYNIITHMEERFSRVSRDHPDFCAFLRSELERIVESTRHDELRDADYRFAVEGAQQMLAEWDACERGKQSGDFIASNDNFEDAWDVVKMPESIGIPNNDGQMLR